MKLEDEDSGLRFELTGEYRVPQKDEWYLGEYHQVPIWAGDSRPNKKRYILRTIDIPDVATGEAEVSDE